MVRRPRALLELLRLSLAPTLVADLCAGVALGAARAGSGRSFDAVVASGLALVARLLPVSFLLFAGGMALNARVDVEEDRVTRPRRPLPSGDVEPAFATLVAAVALPAAPLVAWLCGGDARRDLTIFTLAMAAAIAVYHTPLKQSPIAGPLLLGAIRGGDLLLGAIGAAGRDPGLSAAAFSAGCYAFYVAGASFIAHQEDRDARAVLVRAGALLSLLAIVVHGAAILVLPRGAAAADAFSPSVVVALWHLISLRGAWVLFRPTGFGLVRVETYARLFLSRMSLLPAAAAFAAGNPALGLTSIVAFFAVFALVRFIPPT
jgi:4-hydroxybenzoate polyprenyltransferase